MRHPWELFNIVFDNGDGGDGGGDGDGGDGPGGTSTSSGPGTGTAAGDAAAAAAGFGGVGSSGGAPAGTSTSGTGGFGGFGGGDATGTSVGVNAPGSPGPSAAGGAAGFGGSTGFGGSPGVSGFGGSAGFGGGGSGGGAATGGGGGTATGGSGGMGSVGGLAGQAAQALFNSMFGTAQAHQVSAQSPLSQIGLNNPSAIQNLINAKLAQLRAGGGNAPQGFGDVSTTGGLQGFGLRGQTGISPAAIAQLNAQMRGLGVPGLNAPVTGSPGLAGLSPAQQAQLRGGLAGLGQNMGFPAAALANTGPGTYGNSGSAPPGSTIGQSTISGPMGQTAPAPSLPGLGTPGNTPGLTGQGSPSVSPNASALAPPGIGIRGGPPGSIGPDGSVTGAPPGYGQISGGVLGNMPLSQLQNYFGVQGVPRAGVYSPSTPGPQPQNISNPASPGMGGLMNSSPAMAALYNGQGQPLPLPLPQSYAL